MSKPTIVRKIIVARVTPSAGIVRGVFPEGAWVEASDRTGFCGITSHYTHDEFNLLEIKWQSQSIPAGAVEAEVQRLRGIREYQTLRKRELRATAKDIVSSRTPYATRKYQLVILTGDLQWDVVGINIPEAVFKQVLGLINKADVALPQHRRVLDYLLTTTQHDLVATANGTDYTELLVNPYGVWHGVDTDIKLVCGPTMRLTLDHIKGACGTDYIVCDETELVTAKGNVIRVRMTQPVQIMAWEAAVEFDFGQQAQDEGEAAGNAVYWAQALRNVVCSLFALGGKIERE